MNIDVINYVLYNQSHFKKKFEALTSFRKDLLSNPELSLFHDEIRKQFSERVKKEIIDEITNRLALSTEEVLLIIEPMNVDEYVL